MLSPVVKLLHQSGSLAPTQVARVEARSHLIDPEWSRRYKEVRAYGSADPFISDLRLVSVVSVLDA